MEDIVAIKVTLEGTGEQRFFLTWGRIPDAVDPEPLLDLVRPQVSKCELGGTAAKLELCDTLQDASGERYFHECFFDMCQARRPKGGKRLGKWRAGKLKRLQDGREIYYLGKPD